MWEQLFEFPYKIRSSGVRLKKDRDLLQLDREKGLVPHFGCNHYNIDSFMFAEMQHF